MMSNKKRKTKDSLVEVLDHSKGNQRYIVTALGLEVVRELALLHCTEKEIADHLGMATLVFKKMLDEEHELFDPDLKEAVDEGLLDYKKKIRMRQLDLAETNAQMAIHLGKHYLDQVEKSTVEHTHKHAVVGTMPNYSASSDDWKKQFAPQAMAALSEQKTIEAEDAEVVEIEIETKNETEQERVRSDRDDC